MTTTTNKGTGSSWLARGRIWFLIVCIWISNISFTNGDTNPVMQSLSFTDSSVTKIKLSGIGLTGTLGYNIASMTSLVELDLSNNNLGGGSQLPYNIPPNLRRLNLAGNKYCGNPVFSISQMIFLEYLNFSDNQLNGNLKDMFTKLMKLTTMDLSFNSLSGNLPQSLNSLSSLTNLYLQNNQFSGQIDVLANLPLENLNVANNNFSGWIPDQLKKIKNLRTENNSWSSGPAPSPTPDTPPTPPPPPPPPPPCTPPPTPPPPGHDSGGIGGSDSRNRGRKSLRVDGSSA